MSKNCSYFTYKCNYCFYETNKRYNLIRHQNAKHMDKINDNNKKLEMCENVNPNEVNVTPNELNVIPNKLNVTLNKENVNSKFNCKKCNKSYKTKKFLLIHESKCIGIDDLTCPRCMISFSTRQSKSRHIINNKCKPRSIIHARKPNNDTIETQNINTLNNIQNQTNNYITNNNNIYINNYGNERQDYLTYDKMLEIFKKVYDIPRLLTEELHFNKKFPENNNIQYKNDTNALIKKDDEFILKDLNILAEELVKEKSVQMQKFAEENKTNICTNIETQKYQDIVDLLLHFILLKEPQEHYKKQIKNIRDLIKNN